MFLNIIKRIAALTAVMLLSALILPGPAAALESGGEHFSAYVAIRPIPEEVEEGTEVDLRLEGHETANMNYRIRWERGQSGSAGYRRADRGGESGDRRYFAL